MGDSISKSSSHDSNTKVSCSVTPSSDGFLDEKPFDIAIKEQPVTEERKPYVRKQDDLLAEAGTARANIAASKDSPNGTEDRDYTKKRSNQTVVQQHVEYFGTDRDGVIWPQDTYNGCRGYGWSIPLSFLATLIINLNLSYPTVPGYLPDPYFRIYVDRIYKDKHGSDSMTYDCEGRFRPQNFEDLFAKYDKGDKGGLDKSDFWRAWKGQRLVFDFFGWTATFLEWFATYLLLWPEDGIMRKEDIRGIYDGSTFYKKAEEHKRKQELKAQMKAQGQGSTAAVFLAKAKKLL